MTAPVLQLIGNQAAGTTAQNVAWPANHAPGDLGILVIENSGNDTTQTGPSGSGWTQVTGSPVTAVATTAGSKLVVWYKFATSSAEATVSTGDAGDHQVARIYVFRGVSETGTFNASTTGTKTTASTTATWPSITTTVGETRVVFIASRPDDTNTNTDIFRNYTGGTLDAVPAELSASAEATTSAGNGGGFVLVTATKTAPGATGTPSASMFNASNAALSVTNAYMVFALRPKNFTLTADTVTFNETLQPATLTVDRTLTASSDTFAFNGNDVTLTKTTPAKILTAEFVNFDLIERDATLRKTWRVRADSSGFGIDDFTTNSVFSDNFNRANGALGSNWQIEQGSFQIINNAVNSLFVASTSIATVTSGTYSSDQYAQITAVSFTASYFDWIGVGVRVSGLSGYFFATDSLSVRKLFKRDSSGVATEIGTKDIYWVAGDIIKITANHNIISVYKNNQLVDQVKDSTYTSGVPAIYYRKENNSTTTGDNFEAGSLLDNTALKVSRVLSCATSLYSVEGTETNFNRGVSLTANSQPYTFIGRDATLFPSRYLSLARTTFTITGPPASLIAIADTHTVTIDPPAGWALHLVTDVSQAGISACIYYNLSPAVAVGDQILYRTTTETNSNAVSVSSTGIVSTVPSGSDTLKFRHWRPSTWSAELTFTVGITARTLTADSQTYTLTTNDAILYKSITAPTDIAQSIKGWFDASNESSLTVSSNNLTVWNDLSGQNDHLDTIQGNNPKSRIRTISGKNAIEFNNDGAIYDFDNTGSTSVPHATIGLVFVADANTGTIVSSRTTLDSKIVLNATSNLVMYGNSSNQQASTRTISNSQIYTVVAVFNGTNSKLWINGISESMSSIIEDRILVAMIGAGGAGDTNYFDGLVGEVAIYDNALSDSEALSLNSYLYKKWVLSKTILSDAGAYSLSGSDANFVVSRTLSCDPATYAEDLQPANLTLQRKISSNVGYFRLLTVARQTNFSDNFNRADESLDASANWQRADIEVGSLSIINNRVSGGANIGNVYSGALADDQWAEFTFSGIAPSGTSKGAAVLLRATGGTSSFTGYVVSLERSNTEPGTDLVRIRYCLNVATFTNAFSLGTLLASYRVPDFANNTSGAVVLRAEVVGSIITAYINGSPCLFVSDSQSTSGKVGIWTDSANIDDFNSGSFTDTLFLKANRTLSCDPATYTLELKDATLTKVSAKVLTADSQTYNEDLQPASLKAARTLLATTQTYNEDLQPANLKAARTLLATTQTYNEDLQPANLRIAKRLVADSQIYTFTGRDVSFSSAEVFGTISREYTLSGNNVLFLRSVISSSVAYTFTGRDANLFRGERLTAESRAYNLTGRDATLNHAARVTADTSTFTLTGRDSNLLRGERLTADTSTYTFTGRDANLLRAERVTADVSSFALIGRDANLLRGERVTAESRAYNLTGRDAALNHAARVTADTRSYSLTRNDATLNHAARLTAEFSSYTLATNDANLSVTRKLVADSSSYALTGNTVLFVTTGSLNVTTATFTLTGNSVNFVRSRILVAATQPYNFVPNDAILKTSKKVIADKATYTLTGRAANLAAGEISTSDSQSFILTGNSVRFNRSVKSIVSSYTLTASDTSLKVGRKISLTVSSYITSGIATNLLANKKILAVRVFFDTNGYVDPGYTDPNYVSIDAGIISSRLIIGQTITYNLNGNTVIIVRGGFIKVWMGSAWVSKPLKVWDGTAWVSKPLKVWTGSTWRTY